MSEHAQRPAVAGIGPAVEVPLENGGNRLRGDDLLIRPSFAIVHAGANAIWKAKDRAEGETIARSHGDLYGSRFRDGNRPALWLTKLLLAYNEVVSGDRGGWGELRACATYMPASDAASLLARAVPRRARPPKTAAQIVPRAKKEKPKEAAGAVVGPTTPAQARALVGDALPLQRVQDVGGFSKKPRRDQLAEVKALAAVRKAKLSRAPVEALIAAWTHVGSANAAKTPETHAAALADLRAAIDVAKAAKVIDAATVTRLRSWADSFDYKTRTPDEISASVAGGEDRELARAAGIVAELKELHASLVVERGEFTIRPAGTTRYAHHYATMLAGSGSNTILAALEAALEARDAKAVRIALAREPYRWLVADERFGGSASKLSAYLDQQNKDGIAQGELISDLVGVLPFGPFTKVLLATPIELAKYKTGRQSGASTLLNLFLKAVSNPLDKYLKAKVVKGPLDRFTSNEVLRKAIIDGARGAFENLAQNVVKILTSDRSWSESLAMVEDVFSAAVLAGFTKAIAGSFEKVTDNVSESVRKDQMDLVIKAASAFGLEKPVGDELKRFVPDPPKPQVRPRSISMHLPSDGAREWMDDTQSTADESFQEAA